MDTTVTRAGFTWHRKITKSRTLPFDKTSTSSAPLKLSLRFAHFL